MKISFLGTGSSQGTPVIACQCPTCSTTDVRNNRLRSVLHIDIDGHSILIDAGPDIRTQALRAGIKHVDTLLITHEHRDHIGGIAELRSSVLKQKRPIEMYADERVLACIRQEIHYLLSSSALASFVLHPVDGKPLTIRDITVQPLRAYHGDLPIWGFRLGPLAYITDAKTIPEETMTQLQGTQVLVINALREQPHDAHLSLRESLAIIQQIQPREAYLTHISHQMGLHDTISAMLPNGVALAYDGLKVTL